VKNVPTPRPAATATRRGARPRQSLHRKTGRARPIARALVARLKDASPEQAADVAGTVASFTGEVTKQAPHKITLRALGQSIAEAAKRVADIAGPIVTTVAAVLKFFGIAAL
jgi:hypothetical protein